MKTLIITLTAAAFFTGPVNAGEIIAGKPTVVDSTTIIVSSKKVQLDYVASLNPGTACYWKNRPLDCGVLAIAGLKDLLAGAISITCKQNTSGKHTCTAGGYDLAYGLIHAGWAVPTRKAPAHYIKKMNRAKQRKLGFWGALNSSNKIIATTFQ